MYIYICIYIYIYICLYMNIRSRNRIAKNLLYDMRFSKSYDRNINDDVTEWRVPMYWLKSKLVYQ